MFYDVNHPNVTLSEWEAFKSSETDRQSLITEVVNRRDCGFFPDWYVPLARGVAIAGQALLREAGYEEGIPRPSHWLTHGLDCFLSYVNGPSDELIVRLCDKHEWWIIERIIGGIEEVLVCSFGSTPILTPNYKSAMCLALHCNVDKPPHDLRWIKLAPDDCEGAKEFALKRRIDEAQSERHLAQGRTTATPKLRRQPNAVTP